jgi:hypothetical protein
VPIGALDRDPVLLARWRVRQLLSLEEMMLTSSPPTRRPAALILALVTFLLTMGLFVSTASATVMKYAGLDQLVEMSDVIIHGEVIDQKTYFDKEQQRVVTDTTFEVAHTFYGSVDQTVTIQQWGGTLDDKTHSVPGDAHFEPGEEVIVFLHRGDDVLALSALGQAKFSVQEVDQKRLVYRKLSDIAFLLDSDDQQARIEHLPDESRSYESFVAEVEALTAGIKGKGGDHE